MVRLRQQIQRDTIQLNLVGPKRILPESVTVDAPLDHTWIQVLKDELQIEVAPDSGIYVCTMGYTPSAPRQGQGWRTDITEKVREFTDQFERKKKQYTVRLVDPQQIDKWIAKDVTPRNGHMNRSSSSAGGSGRRRRAPTPMPRRRSTGTGANGSALSGRGPQIVISTQGNHVQQQETENGYSRPRYVHSNRSQQQHYSTRLKRRGTEPTPSTSQQHQNGHHSGTPIRKQPRRDAVQRSAEKSMASTLQMVKLEPDVIHRVVEEYWEDDEMNGQESVPIVHGYANGHAHNHHHHHHLNGVGGGRPMEDEWDQDEMEDDDDDDNASLCTAATQEEDELRRQGIHVEDLKMLVEQRVNRFSNAFMLRVKNEIRRLQRTNMWDRNVNRSPLACYLLQELFKE